MTCKQTKSKYRVVVQVLNKRTLELDESFVDNIVRLSAKELKVTTHPVSESGEYMIFNNLVSARQAQSKVLFALQNSLIYDAVIEKLSKKGEWIRATK